MMRALPLILLLALSACSEYLPIAGGQLEGTVSPLPEHWSELATTEIIQMESIGDAPYSVNLWMVEVDGFIMDLRSAPRELQEAAFEEGLIPYIPADRKLADQETA